MDGVTKGIYKSSDHGERWRVLNKFSLNTQGGYDFDFAVSQIDTQNIVLGNKLMAVSVNGGKTMLTRSEGHVDHHAFIFGATAIFFLIAMMGNLRIIQYGTNLDQSQ